MTNKDKRECRWTSGGGSKIRIQVYAKHVTHEKVTWENNRKNGALKCGVENASKERNA